MSDQNEVDLCVCATMKTRAYTSQNANKCPTCGKKMLEDEPKYEPVPPLEETKGFDMEKLLSGLATANFGSVKERSHNNSIKLKPPVFSGKGDSKHFFVKLENYIESYKISSEETKIRLLKSCLENTALDLFLSLDDETQSDLELLQKKFQQHFAPLGHSLIATQSFMKLTKLPKQTVSEFHIQLKKKADELLLEDCLIKIVFLQGLSPEYQKHCILQKANTLQETLEAALEYEKIAEIGAKKDNLSAMTSPRQETNKISQAQESEMLQKIDAILEMFNKTNSNAATNSNNTGYNGFNVDCRPRDNSCNAYNNKNEGYGARNGSGGQFQRGRGSKNYNQRYNNNNNYNNSNYYRGNNHNGRNDNHNNGNHNNYNNHNNSNQSNYSRNHNNYNNNQHNSNDQNNSNNNNNNNSNNKDETSLNWRKPNGPTNENPSKNLDFSFFSK